MESDVPADTKARERSCSANRVDPDPTCYTSFGDDSTGPLALACSRGDALAGNGAAAPKSCLSSLEMRSSTAACGLLPAGEASTTTRITFFKSCLPFCPTEETDSAGTSTQYALYYNSSFWLNQLSTLSWRRVIQTKSKQNLVFDPGGSKGRLHPCPFWGTWCMLLCGEVLVLKRLVVICSFFFTEGGPRNIIFRSKVQATRTYCGRPLFLRSQAVLKRAHRQGRLEGI